MTLVSISSSAAVFSPTVKDRFLARFPSLADLAAGVRHVGGEARALHLYCEPGAAGDVLAAWRERLGDRMEIRARDDAVRDGWFGPVHARVLPRIGDVLAVAASSVAVVDSRTARPEWLSLVGLHGARTPEEQLVPLLVTVAGER